MNEEVENNIKYTTQILVQNKIVKFNKGVNIIEIPLTNIANLSKDKHHKLKVLIDPVSMGSKLEAKLGGVSKEDLKAYSCFLVFKEEVTSPVRLKVTVQLKTFDCSLQEMQKRQKEAKESANFLKSYLGEDVESKESIPDLISDVNDLFAQAKFGLSLPKGDKKK